VEQSGCVVELGFGVQSEEKLCPSLSLDPNVIWLLTGWLESGQKQRPQPSLLTSYSTCQWTSEVLQIEQSRLRYDQCTISPVSEWSTQVGRRRDVPQQ